MSWNTLETGQDNWNDLVATAPNGAPVGETFSYLSSDVFSNNGNAENLDVRVSIDNILTAAAPNGESPFFLLFVVVEEEVEPGIFRVVADSTAQIINPFTPLPAEREFVIQNKNPSDAGQPFSYLGGFRFNVNKTPSEKMRVCISMQDSRAGGPAGVESMEVTGTYRLY